MLAPIAKRAPEDIRARLLLDEAAQALAADPRAGGADGAAAALESVCGRNGVLPPYLVAGCALEAAARARSSGEGLRASTQSQAAARTVPEEPRMLARAAQLLAQEGFVDGADKLVERASRFASPQTPSSPGRGSP